MKAPAIVVHVSLETLERMRTATELELKVYAACLPPAASAVVLEYLRKRPQLPLPFDGSAQRMVEALTPSKTLARVERALAKLAPRKRRAPKRKPKHRPKRRGKRPKS